MARFMPGSVVFYREPQTGLPWPSIYCTDEVAPKAFLLTRPCSYVTLVLKLTKALDAGQLRWAQSSDLDVFDPFAADESTMQSTPGLADAYEIALSALDSGLDLSHWKAVLSTDQDHDPIVIDSDDDEDSQIRYAIEMSIAEVSSPQGDLHLPGSSASQARRSNAWLEGSPPRTRQFAPHPYDAELSLPARRRTQSPSKLLAPTPSPLSGTNAFDLVSHSQEHPSSYSSISSDDNSPGFSRKRRQGGCSKFSRRTGLFSSGAFKYIPSPMPLASGDDEPHLPLRSRGFNTSSATEPSESSSQYPRYHKRRGPKQGSSVSHLSSRNGLEASPTTAQDAEIIKEDLEKSNQFVQVFVGPRTESDPEADPERKQHRFQLLKCHVWGRPYFRDTVSAISYITPTGENAWELTHPKLSNIDPEDFRFAAEYLTDGDFGHRQPDGEAQVAETFAQCMAALEVAQQLNMDDLQEHVIKKIQIAAPWDMYDAMAFACCVYSSPGVPSEACYQLRDMLSSYIAEHYTIYVRDESLREQFLDRIQQLPELGGDVHVKVAEEHRARCRPNERERELLEQQELTTS